MLDTLYGKSAKPDRDVTDAERIFQPKSMMILDERTAPALRRHMDNMADLHLASYFHSKVPILWLVKHDGSIALALEEVVDETGDYAGLYHRGLYSGARKLGHPSLAGTKFFEARIGGELIMFEEAWWITNRSRRYGLSSRVTATHLANVRLRFAQLGVIVKDRYEPL